MIARGFTTLEIILAATLFTLISAAVFGIATTGQQMYISSGNETKSASRAHGLMGRLINDLRGATILGEDLDQNDDPADLDTEDVNGNGQIDDDWSLQDGTTEQWISFNKILGAGTVSEKITIRFDGNRVLREQQGKTAIIAADVRALTFTRTGNRVDVYLYTEAGLVKTDSDRGGRGLRLTRSVYVRN